MLPTQQLLDGGVKFQKIRFFWSILKSHNQLSTERYKIKKMFQNDFSVDPEIIYLDCAGRSPLPILVERVGQLSVSSKVRSIGIVF